MFVLFTALVALGTFLFMEAWAWFVHKYLLHGPFWFLHQSHHRPQSTWWEWNDLVSLFYGLLSAGLSIYGGQTHNFWLLGLGIGIALYGLLYFFLHDIVIHRRVKYRHRFQHPYLQRLIRAHKIHHKHLGSRPSEAYGFLYATKKYDPAKGRR